ncbi:hypothetical protein AB6A40_010248 [Gnathostoma spinigerum]|uniref:Uncharacterized protein n=1 Tax=Gnathostoma spinigerum TaxID=75299 RepID=A0ABD6F165_9BILA
MNYRFYDNLIRRQKGIITNKCILGINALSSISLIFDVSLKLLSVAISPTPSTAAILCVICHSGSDYCDSFQFNFCINGFIFEKHVDSAVIYIKQ